MSWRIPLFEVDLRDEDVASVVEVLRSGWVSMGEVTRELERTFAQRLGVQDTVAVTNATAGLHLAMKTLGIGQGMEVICPSLTFVATANAIVYAGAKPVFADIVSDDDLTISPAAVESLITNRTRAILVMHYAGYACRMDEIADIAERHGLMVVEDAAHAVGGTYRGKSLGTVGDAGVYSFFSNKNLTTAEGGLLMARDAERLSRARLLRSHGMTSSSRDRYQQKARAYEVVELGFNYRLDDVRSALGLSQLRRFDATQSRRRALVDRYRSGLRGWSGGHVPFAHFDRGESAHHILPVVARTPEIALESRAQLERAGIQTSHHYPPVHAFSYYEGPELRRSDLSITEDVAARQFTLPLFPAMSEPQVDEVCHALTRSE